MKKKIEKKVFFGDLLDIFHSYNHLDDFNIIPGDLGQASDHPPHLSPLRTWLASSQHSMHFVILGKKKWQSEGTQKRGKGLPSRPPEFVFYDSESLPELPDLIFYDSESLPEPSDLVFYHSRRLQALRIEHGSFDSKDRSRKSVRL